MSSLTSQLELNQDLPVLPDEAFCVEADLRHRPLAFVVRPCFVFSFENPAAPLSTSRVVMSVFAMVEVFVDFFVSW